MQASEQSPRRAVLQGLIAVGAGVGNNALIQLLGSLPIAQLVVLRSAGTIMVLGPVLVAQGLRRPTLVAVARAVMEAGGTLLLIVALTRASLSLVSTLMMTIPVGVMAGSAALTGERISSWGKILILLSFAAAIAATAPPLGVNATGVTAAVLSAVCYIARDLFTRRFPTGSSGVEMSLIGSGITLVAALTLLPATPWQPLSVALWPTVVAMVGLYVASNLLIVSATRYGPATLVAATRYSAVIWAVPLDLVLFNRSPGVITMISAAAIGAFSLCLIRTERTVL